MQPQSVVRNSLQASHPKLESQDEPQGRGSGTADDKRSKDRYLHLVAATLLVVRFLAPLSHCSILKNFGLIYGSRPLVFSKCYLT